MNSRNPINPTNFLLFILCFLIFAISSGYAAQSHQKMDIAIFPFANFSEDKNAVTFVVPLLRDRLEAKGFGVLDDDSLNRFLLKNRVRSVGYISTDMARKLGEECKSCFSGIYQFILYREESANRVFSSPD
jgi:hypothetical protein